MRVKTIDENRIVIYLNNQEICDIFGGYEFIDYDAADCRTKIHGLLAAAIPSAIMPFDCDRVLIEVKPEISGCSISLIKLHTVNGNKKTGVKNRTITLIFESIESLIVSIAALNTLKHTTSELYTSGKEYALICTTDVCSREELTHLSEYCEILRDNISAARIREYWEQICEKDVIEELADAFLK